MKLRNKKTGEIIDFASVTREYDGANDIGLVEIGHERGETVPLYSYNSLAELNEEWEDYEEPKDYYFIRSESLTVGYSPISNTRSCRNRKAIGNYFETREEVEKAVDKLKAWQRLKDKGFRFMKYDTEHCVISTIYFTYNDEIDKKDLDLLFGGEE